MKLEQLPLGTPVCMIFRNDCRHVYGPCQCAAPTIIVGDVEFKCKICNGSAEGKLYCSRFDIKKGHIIGAFYKVEHSFTQRYSKDEYVYDVTIGCSLQQHRYPEGEVNTNFFNSRLFTSTGDANRYVEELYREKGVPENIIRKEIELLKEREKK